MLLLLLLLEILSKDWKFHSCTFFPISTVIKFQFSSTDWRVCGITMPITYFQCPKLRRIGNGSWPWHLPGESYNLLFFFLLQRLSPQKCVVLGGELHVWYQPTILNKLQSHLVNSSFPFIFVFCLHVFLYWFFKLLLPKSISFLICFPTLFSKTWANFPYMPWRLGPIISTFMPIPLAKANKDMKCLGLGNMMAYGLSSVEGIFAKWACGPGLYV